ncbi:uncharacterized protein LOC128956566 [Oppia nitens]|uniref:uncharacterized protein LOC128956566 n=1 Tax=Oppia nitens TaxID=1686743 RepID=UPI0023DC6DDB|nr:uncharacterized protein LOC128956566 [Oppia nitens]
MASLRSWFSILRWSLILTLILLIILSIVPLIWPRNFTKESLIGPQYYLINGSVMISLSVFGLCSICYHYFWFTLLFALMLTVYLCVELVFLGGNIGLYLTKLGVIACSFTYCAVLKRFENDELYGV